LGYKTFKLSIQNQTVFEEMQFSGPYKFTKCKIMSDDNWSCLYNDNSGEIGMSQGKFYELTNDPVVKRFQRKSE
jgi:hypothetical protein